MIPRARKPGCYLIVPGRPVSQRGFTLLEILVAFLLLALMGGLLLQAYQGGLIGADSSRQLSRGVFASQSLVAALRAKSKVESGEYQGVFDGGLRWHLQLTPREAAGTRSQAAPRLLKATLDVEWAPQKHHRTETLLASGESNS